MKRFLTLLMCLVCSLCFAAPAMATETGTYSDVPVFSEYYDAVEWAADEGITSGVGGGKFLPDGEVTKGQLMLMLLRRYMPENATFSTDSSSWESLAVGTAEWFGLCDFDMVQYLDEHDVTWRVVWELVSLNDGLMPYPKWCYTGEAPVVDFDADVAYMVSTFGLCDKNPDDKVTRADLVQFLYDVAHENYTKQVEPENFWGDINIVIEEGLQSWRVRNLAMRDWMLIPAKLKQSFVDEGWTLLITDDMRDYYEDSGFACGMCDAREKRITLSMNWNSFTSEILVHEFGHYAAHASDALLFMNYMYDTERDDIAEVVGRSYGSKNREEMFAEVYRYILLNRDDDVKYAELQEKMPLSLAYVERGFLDAEGVSDLDELNAVTHEYWDYICNNKVLTEDAPAA